MSVTARRIEFGTRRFANWLVVATGLVLAVLGTLAAAEAAGVRQAALFLIGTAFGLVLFHAAFGFTGAWRRLLAERDGSGLAAQMLMLAVASLLMLPILAGGSVFGRPVSGAIAPVGVSVLLGAFLFGIGMQLGGGCASGTLYTAGAGRKRMLITLVFFIAGSFIGSLHLPWWLEAPSLGSISLTAQFGLAGALALQLGLFLAIALAVRRFAWRREAKETASEKPRLSRILTGPWPLVAGAIALAGLNALTLAVAGHPWSITFGFSLWGAKAAALAGLDVGAWEFWTWPYPRKALAGGLLEETTSVMNIGILVGAFLAAGLAGRFGKSEPLAWRPVAAAVIGGLLMGYGARLAFGCNIGAFFSGVASGSLHGWLWFAAALVGNLAGLRLRPLFGSAGANGGKARPAPRAAPSGRRHC